MLLVSQISSLWLIELSKYGHAHNYSQTTAISDWPHILYNYTQGVFV